MDKLPIWLPYAAIAVLGLFLLFAVLPSQQQAPSVPEIGYGRFKTWLAEGKVGQVTMRGQTAIVTPVAAEPGGPQGRESVRVRMRIPEFGGPDAKDFLQGGAKREAKGVPKVTFDDVAGQDNAKREVAELVDILKKPESYTRLGAEAPRGVLLMGPPGTGRTLPARAMVARWELSEDVGPVDLRQSGEHPFLGREAIDACLGPAHGQAVAAR